MVFIVTAIILIIGIWGSVKGVNGISAYTTFLSICLIAVLSIPVMHLTAEPTDYVPHEVSYVGDTVVLVYGDDEVMTVKRNELVADWSCSDGSMKVVEYAVPWRYAFIHGISVRNPKVHYCPELGEE